MMTHDEFVEKECRYCGSQRCYGVEFCNKYKVNVCSDEEFTKAYKDYMDEYHVDSNDMSDEEYEAAAQEAHDELVRSLIEAGGEIRELKEMLCEAKDALFYMLVLHDSTHGHNMRGSVPVLYHLQSDNRWNVQKAKEALKKISEYCEQGET